MSKSIKSLLVLALAGAAANSAMAQDGTIHFEGKITAASCEMKPGNGGEVKPGQPNDIFVKLGEVSKNNLVSTGGGANIIGSKNINLVLDCQNGSAGVSTVHLTFLPEDGGTGLDGDDLRLLKVTGGATGVGIGLFNDQDQLLNLGGLSTEITGPLAVDATDPLNVKYSANLALRAAYVANGTTITEGQANGTLPFALSYD